MRRGLGPAVAGCLLRGSAGADGEDDGAAGCVGAGDALVQHGSGGGAVGLRGVSDVEAEPGELLGGVGGGDAWVCPRFG